MAKHKEFYVGDRVRISPGAVIPVIASLIDLHHRTADDPLITFLRSTDTYVVSDQNGTSICDEGYDECGNTLGEVVPFQWIELEGVTVRTTFDSDWFELAE